MISQAVNLLLKPFLGTGITARYPFLRKIYEFIYNKLNKGFKSAPIPLGLKLKYNAADSGLGVYLSLTGEYEPFTTRIFLDNIKNSDTFVDVGANVGYFSLLGAKSGATVHSFEPDKNNLELLKENFKLNGLKGNVYAIALGNKEGDISFVENTLQQGNSQVSQTETGNKVKISKLDNFVKDGIKPNFFKVDIEGYEIEFLNGGENYLSTASPVKMVLECNQQSLEEFGHSVKALLDKLKQFGFTVKVIDEHNKELFDAGNSQRFNEILSKYNYTNLWCEK
jgi:FkbM family methyltransferase